MASKRPLSFVAGDSPTLLCVGAQLDVLHARIIDPSVAPADDLTPRDRQAVPRGRSLVVRTGISQVLPVPGEWFEIEVERSWRFGNTDFLSGNLERCWLDLPAVNLPPIGLTQQGEWTLEEWLNVHGLQVRDLEPEYGQVIADGPRREVELEQVLPTPFTRLELEEDGILEALQWRRMGDSQQCEKILSEMLRQDLRCIDAHAHLGNVFLEGYWGEPHAERARRHYRVGVEIAESSLAPDGRDATPRGWLHNRPYLRALHGLGLANWALRKLGEAERCFAKLLWRDPSDGSGARFLLPAVRDGISYEEFDG